MDAARKRTVLLGLAFLLLLLLASFENTVFFTILRVVLQNHLLAVGMLFIHNVLVISLILLGMSFYVNLVVSNFFKREKYSHIALEHPRTFTLIFTLIIVFLSILRGGTLLYGGIILETLPLILLMSMPVGLVEGYGIYFALKKTLSRTLSTKDLTYIYGIFLIAAVIEVAFINILITILAVK